MKTSVADPWSSVDSCGNGDVAGNLSDLSEASSSATAVQESFEDSFVDSSATASEDLQKLPDSEQYLARLQSRLKALQGGTSKRDLINSLSEAKEDCIARLITAGQNLETAEERELAANPVIRHIAPHLQALTANELVHLLKADVLQKVVDEQNNQSENEDTESKSTDSQPDIQSQDCNGL